jgi:RNA polymerase sigma factor (sigma-70 family)
MDMHEIAADRDIDGPTPPARDAFADFYRAEFGGAVRLAWLLTNRGADSEDLVQDAFARIAGRFASLETPSAYLRVAIVNACREAHRRREREQRRIERVAAEPQRSPEASDGDDAQLLRLVAALPYPQRAVLVLRYWSDLPDTEIARVLDVRPTTVRSMAHRATRRLQKELSR